MTDQALAEALDWQPIETAPEREPVETKIDGRDGPRNIGILERRGRLWFALKRDGALGMYVYYQPTHWRRLPTYP
jgi:hypothetical protein